MKSKCYKSSHLEEIFSDLNEERKSSEGYCDFVLTVGSKDFHVHKCILGKFSPYYHTMFTTRMRENYENKACVQGVSEETMEVVLNFVYTGKVTITTDTVCDLMEAANYMEISHLKDCCVEFLLGEIDMTNCVSLLKYSKMYNIDEGIRKANNVIAENFEALMKENDLKELDFESFYKIMQIKEKQVFSEESVFHALMDWIKHDVTARDQHITELFNELELESLSLDFLDNVVGTEELIMGSLECTKILFKTTLSRCKTDRSSSSSKRRELKSKFLAFKSKSVFEFDVKKKEVTLMPDLKHVHCNGSPIVHDQRVYLVNGNDSVVERMDLNVYKMKWYQFSGSKARRDGSDCALCIDCIFTVGGCNGNISKTGERYCILENTWNWIPEMNEGRWRPAVASSGGFLFVLGGFDFANPMRTVECYNVQNGRWKLLPSMKVARYEFAAVVLDNKLYAIGGYAIGALNKVECYDLLKKEWHDVAELNVARSSHGACVLDGKIYVAGGKTNKVEVYDPAKDSWKVLAEVPDLFNVGSIAAL